jgi:hypothetical protein
MEVGRHVIASVRCSSQFGTPVVKALVGAATISRIAASEGQHWCFLREEALTRNSLCGLATLSGIRDHLDTAV